MSRTLMLESIAKAEAADPLVGAARELERQAGELQRDRSRFTLWKLVTAAAGASHALQAHERDCAAERGPLGTIAGDPAYTQRVRLAWVEHAPAERHLNALIGLANSVVTPGDAEIAVLAERARECVRRLLQHHARATDLVYEWTLRDTGGEG